jgi:hypothetical protein
MSMHPDTGANLTAGAQRPTACTCGGYRRYSIRQEQRQLDNQLAHRPAPRAPEAKPQNKAERECSTAIPEARDGGTRTGN